MGFHLEFGIGVRGSECFYDGAIRRSKKFSDRFSRFDTILAVTDSQPPTQPPSHPHSHVAIAITLNAEASSLKSLYKASGSLVCESCEALIKDDENNDNNLDTGHGVSL